MKKINLKINESCQTITYGKNALNFSVWVGMQILTFFIIILFFINFFAK